MKLRIHSLRVTAGAVALVDGLRGRRRSWHTDPQHRSIVVIDVVGFGRRTDLAQLHVRAKLDDAVRAACRASGLPVSRLVFEDRGDGVIVFVPATVSKAVLIRPFVPQLRDWLHDHNAESEPAHRVRVRVAVHAGEVVHGPHGWIGTDLNLTCRLADSAALREQVVRQPRAEVVAAVSDVIHRAVVRHGHRGIDTDSYTQVHVEAKEVATRAWIQAPMHEARCAVTTFRPAPIRHPRAGTAAAAATT
jgi:hypothetical protein